LSGVTPGRYFIWDGIRGIDYLLTRDDVDNHKVGALAVGETCLPLIHAAAFPRSVYTHKNALGNLRIVSSYESIGSLINWAFK